MSVPKGHTVVSVVVPIELRDALHAQAAEKGVSVSRMLHEWLRSGATSPMACTGKRQAVRKYKNELMVSLPREFIRMAGIENKQRVVIGYSDDALIVHP